MEVKELWKPLQEYKGIEVSSIGRVRKAANKRRKERILTEKKLAPYLAPTFGGT